MYAPGEFRLFKWLNSEKEISFSPYSSFPLFGVNHRY